MADVDLSRVKSSWSKKVQPYFQVEMGSKIKTLAKM